MLAHLLLQVSIESFFWIELGAVTWQVEQLNQVVAFSHPGFHYSAVVYPQVVQNQKDFLTRILDQDLQEFNEFVRIKRFINNHSACLAAIGHGGDHGKLLPFTSYGHGYRGFACRCKTSTTHIRVDKRSIIAPVNLGTVTLGVLLDGGVLTFPPGLYRFGALFVGALDGFLWSESPTCKIFADAAHV